RIVFGHNLTRGQTRRGRSSLVARARNDGGAWPLHLTRRSLLCLAGAAAMPLPAAAQEWPARPIRLIVGTSPGGSPDIIGRVLGEKLGDRLGQSVFIEDITQGAGAGAYQIVS